MMSFEVSSSQSRQSPDTRHMDGIFVSVFLNIESGKPQGFSACKKAMVSSIDFRYQSMMVA